MEQGYKPAAEVSSMWKARAGGSVSIPALCSPVLALRTCLCPRFVFRHPERKGWSWLRLCSVCLCPSVAGTSSKLPSSAGSVVGLGWDYPTPGLSPELWSLCALARDKAVVSLQEEEE